MCSCSSDWPTSLYIYRSIKSLTRYVSSSAFYHIAIRNFVLVILVAVMAILCRLPMPPRSSWILLWLLLTGFTGSVRFVLRDLLLNLRSSQYRQKLRVAIYGAGEAVPNLLVLCVSLVITRSSPFSTTTRPSGTVPSMAWRFNHPRC